MILICLLLRRSYYKTPFLFRLDGISSTPKLNDTSFFFCVFNKSTFFFEYDRLLLFITLVTRLYLKQIKTKQEDGILKAFKLEISQRAIEFAS